MPKDFRKFKNERYKKPLSPAEKKECREKYENLLLSGRPLTSFTYSSMKEEFLKTAKFLQSKGYDKIECPSFLQRGKGKSVCSHWAYESICVRMFFIDDIVNNPLKIYTLMASIIELLYCIDNEIPRNIKWIDEILFGKFVNDYRENRIDRLSFSPEDIKAFENDLERAENSRALIIPEIFEKPIMIEEDIWENFIEMKPCYIPRLPDRDGKLLARMKEKLSPRAFDMLTEFNRKDHFDPDKYEKVCLIPRGLTLTDKVREFIELYDGRVYAWTETFNYVDYPASELNLTGFTIDISDDRIVTFGGHYYIEVMDYHYAAPSTIFICDDGTLYDECFMSEIADSAEGFFEAEAERYALESDIMSRRVEIENKYFIPELRAASL